MGRVLCVSSKCGIQDASKFSKAGVNARVSAMQNLHLERRDWQTILDRISRSESEHKVTIEIDREDIGSQKEAENVQFLGLSYDPKGATIAIRAGAVEHMISKPEHIDIAHAGTALICMEVTGHDRTR